VQIGLNDQHDIKMLVYLMLSRLGKVAATAISQSKSKKIENGGGRVSTGYNSCIV
jgi:cullin-associated NEDD8-dissociated protein 1